MPDRVEKHGMRWIPDYPDFRDYTEGTKEIKLVLGHEEVPKAKSPAGSVDLREWCSSVEDQGAIGSCTAHAGAGIIEYYERKSFRRHIDASRLFPCKVTRDLMKMGSDTGAYLRATMGAMGLFGVPPDGYWPYTNDEKRFDQEPPSFCHSIARNYQTNKYFRHDPPGTKPDETLRRVKTSPSKGNPVMSGFTVYRSIERAESTGESHSYPRRMERSRLPKRTSSGIHGKRSGEKRVWMAAL
jgi:C1A family cysteine protease